VSWPWIVLFALALVVVGAAEWPRLERALGADARRRRDRARRKAKLHVVSTDDDDFVESVTRDLENLPTIEERETGPR
jgi:Sec-independent protein translocase protein TatA